MGYNSVADLMLSMETKRHIKSKKRRIRKKHQYKDFWLKKKKGHTCLYCDREYRVYDSDADTPKEQFCSEECYHMFERDLDVYLASKEKDDVS